VHYTIKLQSLCSIDWLEVNSAASLPPAGLAVWNVLPMTPPRLVGLVLHCFCSWLKMNCLVQLMSITCHGPFMRAKLRQLVNTNFITKVYQTTKFVCQYVQKKYWKYRRFKIQQFTHICTNC